MRFLHIADVHLGASPDSGMPWDKQRESELWNSFNRIIDVCNEEKVDLLLIAGDLFHRQPLLRELKEVNYCFGKLETASVVLMAGNHDFLAARSYYRDFEWNDRVHMFMNESIEAFELPQLKTVVYGLSYTRRNLPEPFYDNVRPEHPDKINILLAHGGDEKNIPINRRKLLEAGFDYIALGHIHKPEIISDRMAYSGSLEPVDKTEQGSRGYIIGDIELAKESLVTSVPAYTRKQGKTTINIRFVPFSSREYRVVELNVDTDTTNGSLIDMAKEAIKVGGDQHIYSFVIKGKRDEQISFNAESIKKLGNVYEVMDESLPDFDFDALCRDNLDNLIGMFIQRIGQKTDDDEIAKKALYFGIEALLEARK